MSWTTTELLADIRRLGQLPTSISDAELLAHANYEAQNYLSSLLLRTAEEYLTQTVDVPLVAGQARYAIPRRSVGSRVRDVALVRAGTPYHLPRLKPEQIDSYQTTLRGCATGFYLDAANIVLLPTPSAADTLRVRYYVRPARLTTLGSFCIQITAVTPDTPTAGRTRLTFGSYSLSGGVCDVVSGLQPFETKGLDMTAANVTGTTLDVAASALLAVPVVGDYLCQPDFAPVVQAPIECFGLLAQRAAARALQGLGYLEESNAAWQAAGAREADVVAILTPRTDGNPKRLTGGLLGQMSRGWGWR